MTNASSKASRVHRNLPAIVAMGSSLAAAPAAALELGDLTVQSRLGQPLRASIAFALAPNEQIADYCVTLRPGPSVSGLPGIGNASVSVANGVIMLAGNTPVREPMVAAHVVVNCPYSANLSREYMAFIDPISTAYAAPVVTQQVTEAAAPVAVNPETINRPVASVAATPVVQDITTSTRYQVQNGDTLSAIASRIENRPVGLWPAVNAIFAANPDAFQGNDPNRLKSGSWLDIPDFGGQAATVAPVQPAATVTETATATPIQAENSVDASSAALAAYDTGATDSNVNAVPIVLDDLTDAAVVGGNAQPTEVIIDTALPGPTTESSSPNVATAIITTPAATDAGGASKSWWFWMAGSGIAVFIGLLLFGRRFRGDAEPVPMQAAVDEQPRRRFSDLEGDDTDNVAAVAVDFDLSDDSPTQENLALDADLVIGTGLTAGKSAESDQEFAFAQPTELDIELPFEPAARISEETDIIPPLRTDEHSILDSEVLPDEEDDYDMSVVVDATKMPMHDDITERDLRAVEIEPDDATMIAENYTISKEVDYHVLEQDYEEELTATQALNEEISRAAAELLGRNDDKADDELTAALPLATVTELDVTAQMPARNQDFDDADETVNEEVTVNIEADDETAEMPIGKGKAG